MFGGFRFALSLLVVWYHLVDREFAGPVAVFGFFCLSGYLMTVAINEVYSDGLSGFRRYLVNRALRIYPTYFFALALAAIAVSLVPDAALRVSGNFTWPAFPLTDLVILGHLPLTESLLPQSWSLSAEIIFYIAMGALLSRRRLFTVLWFVFSVELAVMAWLWRDFPFSWFQFSLGASSLAFSSGAMIYHFRAWIPRLTAPYAIVIPSVAILAAVFMPRDLGKSGGLYFCLLITAAAVATLSTAPRRGWDGALGDLAYPIFLLHYPCAAAVIAITGSVDWRSDVLSTAVTIGASYVALLLIEGPLVALRRSIRTVTPPLPARTSSPRSTRR